MYSFSSKKEHQILFLGNHKHAPQRTSGPTLILSPCMKTLRDELKPGLLYRRQDVGGGKAARHLPGQLLTRSGTSLLETYMQVEKMEEGWSHRSPLIAAIKLEQRWYSTFLMLNL